MMSLKCRGLFLMIVEYKYLNSGSVDRWRRKTSLTPLNWLTVQDHYNHFIHTFLIWSSCIQAAANYVL